VEVFSIIYKLAEWLGGELQTRIPLQKQEERTAAARIIKVFSNIKNRYVVGGRVEEGTISVGKEIKLMRREVEVGRGEIVGLQANKAEVKKVESGSEFGAMLKLSAEPQHNDYIEMFEVVLK